MKFDAFLWGLVLALFVILFWIDIYRSAKAPPPPAPIIVPAPAPHPQPCPGPGPCPRPREESPHDPS